MERCSTSVAPLAPSVARSSRAGIGEARTAVRVRITVCATSGRVSSVPAREDLATLGASGATLVLHLSINNLAKIVRELAPLYGMDCPAAVIWRASWPDQAVLRGTLATIREQVKASGFTRTALIIVGRVLASAPAAESRLYAADHHHVLRPRGRRG